MRKKTKTTTKKMTKMTTRPTTATRSERALSSVKPEVNRTVCGLVMCAPKREGCIIVI
jgi:hypothetical protein